MILVGEETIFFNNKFDLNSQSVKLEESVFMKTIFVLNMHTEYRYRFDTGRPVLSMLTKMTHIISA